MKQLLTPLFLEKLGLYENKLDRECVCLYTGADILETGEIGDTDIEVMN